MNLITFTIVRDLSHPCWRALVLLGLHAEARGNTWSTWLVDLDDEPPHPQPGEGRRR